MNRRKFLLLSSAGLALSGLGVFAWMKRWKYIVVHHSAGSYGDIAFLQQVHRDRQPKDPVDAIPYHYVIGNGNGLKLGEVASDWRQDMELWGAHVSANNLDRNFRGIGICLIGNFDKAAVPEAQYDALIALTKKLMRQYAILPANVSVHGQVPGEATRCPGKFFPFKRFKRDIMLNNT